jgi:hypothetical protein
MTHYEGFEIVYSFLAYEIGKLLIPIMIAVTVYAVVMFTLHRRDKAAATRKDGE